MASAFVAEVNIFFFKFFNCGGTMSTANLYIQTDKYLPIPSRNLIVDQYAEKV